MGSKYILATDPRGLPVEFWDERWHWITQKHPDLLVNGVTEDYFREAIENPSDGCIFASKKYPDSCLYYTRFSSHLQIKVVVRYVANVGEITTAHFLKERPSGEIIFWMRGKNG